MQAGELDAVTKAVEGFGGFATARADREGLRPPRQLLGDLAVRADLPGPGGDVRPGRAARVHRDVRGLASAARPQRHQPARGEYITAFDEEGKEVSISFATQNRDGAGTSGHALPDTTRQPPMFARSCKRTAGLRAPAVRNAVPLGPPTQRTAPLPRQTTGIQPTPRSERCPRGAKQAVTGVRPTPCMRTRS